MEHRAAPRVVAVLGACEGEGEGGGRSEGEGTVAHRAAHTKGHCIHSTVVAYHLGRFGGAWGHCAYSCVGLSVR